MVGWGGLLTAGVTALLWLGWGREAILPGLTFGALAMMIQVVAVALVRPTHAGPYARFVFRWGMGMGLRLAGVVAFVVAVAVAPDAFPPLPTAFGYLGVLIPLLFTETRFLT